MKKRITSKEIGDLLRQIPIPEPSPEFTSRIKESLSSCQADLEEISNLLKEIPVPEPTPDLTSRIEEHLSSYQKLRNLCPQIKEMFSLYADNLLASEEKSKVEEHLKICDSCNRELSNWQEIHSLLKEIAVPEPSPDLSLQIENLLLRASSAMPRRQVAEEETGCPPLRWDSDEDVRRGDREKVVKKEIGWRQYIPSLRLTALAGATAAAIFLLVLSRTYLPRRQADWKKTSPQLVAPPSPVPVAPPAVKEEAPEVKVSPEIAKKILPPLRGAEEALRGAEEAPPPPPIPVAKAKVLSLFAEIKPRVETLSATILKQEASFTTLSFLPQEEQIYSSLYNGNNLWLGLFTAPAKLVKVNPQGDYTIYTCAPGDDNATSMVFAKNYLWVGLDTVPLKILKISPEDGSYVSYLLDEPIPKDGTGGTRNAACFDGKYLWFGLWTKPARLVRVDPEDLSYEIYTCKEGEDNPSFALYDGKNVWFGLYTAPAKYIKVNPLDGTYLVYSCKEGENYIKAGVYDSKNIWFGLETTPGKFVKVNSEDGTYIAYNLREGENIVSAATFAQRYLWFALSTEPAKILQVNPSTGNYIAYSRRDIKKISSASFDGNNLWFPDRSGRLLKVSL